MPVKNVLKFQDSLQVSSSFPEVSHHTFFKEISAISTLAAHLPLNKLQTLKFEVGLTCSELTAQSSQQPLYSALYVSLLLHSCESS